MDFKKISEDINGAEGIKFDNVIYIREDEVMRLILQYAYNIEYIKPEES